MNKNQWAIDLIKDTFQSKFDKAGYIKFIKSLLNEADFSATFSYKGNLIFDDFEKSISLFERVAKYSDGKDEIDVLIVHLRRDGSVDRARTMQRNFIAKYLSRKDRKAALVAFVAPNGEDWRFSLVKLEVKLEANDEGQIKVKDEFTPARRWSFLVGSHEKSHTAQKQFVPMMADTDKNPTLAQLEEAFNIEKVTKEFFEKYRGLFIWTKDELDKTIKKNAKTKADFESKGIDTVNLAKKLLGQIVFLYYLQKKGWFGVPTEAAWGEGSKNFLRELFEKKHGDYKNFFNDILEPLFYDALRMDRSHDDHYYRLFDCKIPFLNGGLFDPMNNYDWVKTEILLSNELFSNKNQTDEGDTGDGILDIFDRYNFTVKEDEPFEKEVAIDPELLGKAYEKFNAIRPDNYGEFLKALESGKKGEESKFNKQYGVYYTPREIVHYMCQQSLINYLHTELNPKVAYQTLGDEKLDMFGNTVKTGQFDLTTEHAVEEFPKEAIALLIQHGEDLREHEAQAADKKTATYSPIIAESIRKNAALIDEKLANIKVCDPAVGSGAFPVGMMSEIVRARDVLKTWSKTKKTVYDFKRECIENSLYGVDIDSGAVEIAKLRLWLSLVVDEDDPQHIKPLPNLDYKIVCGNSLVGVEKNLFNVHLFAELESLKPLFFNATNPSKKQEYKKKIDSLIDQITDGRAQFDFDIYFSEVFHEQAGFDVVIGNPPYVQIKGIPASERRFYEDKYKFATGRFNIFYLFIEKTKAITKTNGLSSYIIPDRLLLNTQTDALRKWLLNENQILEIVSFDEQVFETAVVDSIILSFENSPRRKDFIIAKTKTSPQELSVKNSIKIPYSYIALSPSAQFDLNFSPSKHKLIQKVLRNSVTLGEISDTKDGIIQSKIGDLLFIKKQINTHCRKLLVGENVTKFSIAYNGMWVDYRPEVMAKLEEERGGDGLRLRSREIYERPKILTRQTADEIIAGFDEDQNYYYANTLHGTFIVDNKFDAKFVLGILNSKVTTWFYRSNSDEEGKTFAQIKIELLRRLPIPKVETPSQKPIVKLVERILAAKGGNPQADTSKEESAIDEMVYQLYGLTEEEIKIVEGKG